MRGGEKIYKHAPRRLILMESRAFIHQGLICPIPLCLIKATMRREILIQLLLTAAALALLVSVVLFGAQHTYIEVGPEDLATKPVSEQVSSPADDAKGAAANAAAKPSSKKGKKAPSGKEQAASAAKRSSSPAKPPQEGSPRGQAAPPKPGAPLSPPQSASLEQVETSYQPHAMNPAPIRRAEVSGPRPVSAPPAARHTPPRQMDARRNPPPPPGVSRRTMQNPPAPGDGAAPPPPPPSTEVDPNNPRGIKEEADPAGSQGQETQNTQDTQEEQEK